MLNSIPLSAKGGDRMLKLYEVGLDVTMSRVFIVKAENADAARDMVLNAYMKSYVIERT